MKRFKFIVYAVLTAMICFGFTISASAVEHTIVNGTISYVVHSFDGYVVGVTPKTICGSRSSATATPCYNYENMVRSDGGYNFYTWDITQKANANIYDASDTNSAQLSTIRNRTKVIDFYCSYSEYSTNKYTGFHPGRIKVVEQNQCYASLGWTHPYNDYVYATQGSTERQTITIPVLTNVQIQELTLKNCSYTASAGSYNTVTSFNLPCTINGGQYTGQPAINNAFNIVVEKGTITDKNNSHSAFTLGPESEQTVITSTEGGGTTTITTVKLSNPPVIIDWADFPSSHESNNLTS